MSNINSLVAQMQQILERENGTLSGGFLSINEVISFPPIPAPQYSSVNDGPCNNHSCPDSTNGSGCTNHTDCGNTTNGGPVGSCNRTVVGSVCQALVVHTGGYGSNTGGGAKNM